MLTSSSPTLSAPPSPSTAFHAAHSHSHSAHRSYNARRASVSSTSRSPLFHAVSSQTARRFDTPQTPKAVPLFASNSSSSSPQGTKRAYADAGTQYSPAGFPPTYHPPQQAAADEPAASALSAPAIVDTQRAESAASAATAAAATDPPAPPEPALRVDPSPATAQHAQPQTRKTPRDAPRDEHQQRIVPTEAGPASKDEVPSSPAKRLRPPEASVKIMPLKYETCDVKDLGVLISDMLMELVRLNDGYPLRDGQLTRFHSRAPPGISVRDYLLRLIVHATLSPPILLAMVFYVDKLCATYPAFTISSLTVHRFLITAATVAAKGLSDSFWTNTLYARVGGVSVRELALLELEFLRKLDWRIVPKPEVLVDYYKGLVERGTGYNMEKEPESAPNSSLERVTSPTGSATGIHTSQ
ncbi:Pho80p cyclin [Didymella pomorum]|uniref:Pho80p cyclin n=1 Tax=Didymella pomorum TaxID=749634 RepID=A0A9W8Z5N8_9PLEO|nr:Pho80p cyclin [Didymella pomorum]